MKKKTIIIRILFAIFCLAPSFWTQPGWARPIALAVEPVYTFEPVAEGTHITHVFIVKNTGDTLLSILGVSPP